MIHFYTQRKWRSDEYKILCTNDWFKGATEEKRKYGRTAIPSTVVSVAANTTCPKCLEILIPREEAKIAKMKLHWVNGMQNQTGVNT